MRQGITEPTMPFADWFDALQTIAWEKDQAWLTPSDHEDFYERGATPRQALYHWNRRKDHDA